MTVQPTIVFDLDGTLADTIHDLVSALNRTLERSELSPFKPSDIAYLTGKGGLRAMIAHAFTTSDRQLERSHLEDLFAATVKDYDQNIAVETRLYPSVQASLETIHSKGWLFVRISQLGKQTSC
ncbi:HAD hydrolase-like protein [uncultured Tateyamaria sp.]|uniref:HAD hydrolase-like protein n=1 Tax=uncultured Tateyamaria sp. TaxID=455651 RepID=UPI0026250E12|nr:HAD hydrolase-like protein [uncultured Tateyamaria sp.]